MWRLVSFARQDQSAPQRVNLNGLVAGLTRFREPEWRVLGLRHQSQLSPEPAEIAGVASQIEQVCLNVLVYAEQRAAESPAKTIAVKTSVLAGRALVEIDYSPPHGSDAEPDPFAETTSAGASGGPTLEVCLGILRNHGGDARMRRRPGLSGIEIELPLAPASNEPAPRSPGSNGQQPQRPLTLMLVDPEMSAQRGLVTALGSKGHRVVPSTAEGAGDIVQRLHFDAVLWAVRPGRSGWSEFHDRYRASIPAFVLIADSYDPQLAQSLGPRGGFLLSRPVQDKKLSEILREIAARTPACIKLRLKLWVAGSESPDALPTDAGLSTAGLPWPSADAPLASREDRRSPESSGRRRPRRTSSPACPSRGGAASAIMKARMAASSCQAVHVQKVFLASRNSSTPDCRERSGPDCWTTARRR